jgi:HTH-type transcriptional regulator/antitoxin HigA
MAKSIHKTSSKTGSYEALMASHRLKVIATDKELDAAVEFLRPLFRNYDSLDKDSQDYVSVLSTLIQEYENRHHKIDTDDLDPVDALKFLMEEHDLNQSDIARILDSERGLVSEILSGKKNISKAKAVILANHFNTDVGMFIKGSA